MPVAILPGHSKTTDNDFRLTEHLACRTVAGIVWDLLEDAQVEIWIPGDDLFQLSNDASLNERVRQLNAAHRQDPITLGVELHLNGGRGDYSCCLHHRGSKKGETAAWLLGDEFSRIFPWAGKKSQTPEDFGRSDLMWLSGTMFPAVICEPGFLDNDSHQWDQGSQIVKYAISVVAGVLAYLEQM